MPQSRSTLATTTTTVDPSYRTRVPQPETRFDLRTERSVAMHLWRWTTEEHKGSFGSLVFERQMSFYTLKGWDMTGDLMGIAHSYQEVISAYIDDFILDLDMPWRSYAIRCFLLGPNKKHATPYIVILCDHADFSKALRSKILQSSILEHPWGCLRLPYSAVALADTPQLGHSGDRYSIMVHGFSIPEILNSVPIEIWQDYTYIGRASIGGVVTATEEDGSTRKYAMTVAHAFENANHLLLSSPALSFELDESELDNCFDYHRAAESHVHSGITEQDWQDDDEPELSDTTIGPNPVILPTTATTTVQTRSAESPAPQFRNKTLLGFMYVSSAMNKDNRGLDWGLIHVIQGKETAICRNYSSLRRSPRPITAWPPTSAYVATIAMFGLPGSRAASPQRATAIRFHPRIVTRIHDLKDSQIANEGDSGRWLFSTDGKYVIGMLIGACAILQEEYYLSFSDVCADIERQTQWRITIDSTYDQLLEEGNRKSTIYELEKVEGSGKGKISASDPYISPSVYDEVGGIKMKQRSKREETTKSPVL